MTTFRDQLEEVDSELVPLTEPDTISQLLATLRLKYPPTQAVGQNGGRAWDYSGLVLREQGRLHEALAVHCAHYEHLLEGQQPGARIHKGTPLVRISDCFGALGYRVHAQRYLMLTLCEDAIQGNGVISAQNTGVYFRLVLGGVTAEQLQAYAADFFELATQLPDDALFPEALLQRLDDDDWLTAFPSEAEALFYRVNPNYTRYLLAKMGDRSGKTLELFAQYLMSCMAGCRARTRMRSGSTDYDIVRSEEHTSELQSL
jgi:hypothetical protein